MLILQPNQLNIKYTRSLCPQCLSYQIFYFDFITFYHRFSVFPCCDDTWSFLGCRYVNAFRWLDQIDYITNIFKIPYQFISAWILPCNESNSCTGSTNSELFEFTSDIFVPPLPKSNGELHFKSESIDGDILLCYIVPIKVY